MAFFQTQYYGQAPIQVDTFLIESQSDLTNLPVCLPGSVAYTADKSAVYIKDVDGQWVEDPTQESAGGEG